MKPRTILVALLFCLSTAAAVFAQDAFMGTWKLNESKSKVAAGAAKNNTVTYAAAGDQIKVTIDGTDASGNASHNEWTGQMDGKDYPVTGDPTSDMRSVQLVNAHTATFAAKKDGKTTITGRIVVAPDGKSRTVTTNGTDATGKKTTGTSVYDKQ